MLEVYKWVPIRSCKVSWEIIWIYESERIGILLWEKDNGRMENF